MSAARAELDARLVGNIIGRLEIIGERYGLGLLLGEPSCKLQVERKMLPSQTKLPLVSENCPRIEGTPEAGRHCCDRGKSGTSVFEHITDLILTTTRSSRVAWF